MTTQSKHTPGLSERIRACNDTPGDARLADAAPELLDALRYLVQSGPGVREEALAKARAAIAKAAGK